MKSSLENNSLLKECKATLWEIDIMQVRTDLDDATANRDYLKIEENLAKMHTYYSCMFLASICMQYSNDRENEEDKQLVFHHPQTGENMSPLDTYFFAAKSTQDLREDFITNRASMINQRDRLN